MLNTVVKLSFLCPDTHLESERTWVNAFCSALCKVIKGVRQANVSQLITAAEFIASVEAVHFTNNNFNQQQLDYFLIF